MAFRYLGPDRLEVQLDRVLEELANGKAPKEIELKNIDIKEEPTRRGPRGEILQGESKNERAAAYLAHELACLANTPGAGAIILGISDDGEHIGTSLDPEWVRHRIYQLTHQRMTVDVRVGSLNDTRLLILRAPEALEPIRSKQRIFWRVADNCVEVDAASWSERRLYRAGYDWSAQVSGHRLTDARPAALEAARHFLRQAGDEGSQSLASASDEDLLRRLNVVASDGVLTNAGSLLFVSTPEPGLDYIRRDFQGADSTLRVTKPGPLLAQLAEVETAAMASNPTVHVPAGLSHGQIRALPRLALREAVVNGIVHRDWMSPAPTVIEHVGNILTVTSPGGFVAGVSPSNIITHPSTPRYRSLANVVSALRLSEREGIGVDRMVAEMLASGYERPEIQEIDGPYVRVTLLGGTPDLAWMEFLSRCSPPSVSRDVDTLLLFDELIARGWIDVLRASPVLQRSTLETRAAILRLEEVRSDGKPVIVPVSGVPTTEDPAWRLSDTVRATLHYRIESHFEPSGRLQVVMDWAAKRNRVSSSEVADLTGVTQSYANTILKRLEDEGTLEPSRPNRRGRGFYYRPA